MFENRKMCLKLIRIERSHLKFDVPFVVMRLLNGIFRMQILQAIFQGGEILNGFNKKIMCTFLSCLPFPAGRTSITYNTLAI